jgi:hypothetical protein
VDKRNAHRRFCKVVVHRRERHCCFCRMKISEGVELIATEGGYSFLTRREESFLFYSKE